jgi:putative transcriptional regulator
VTEASLRGRLLVALPVLRDVNFDRTVVYMVEHSEEGALGLVLNRPSPLTIGEPLPRWVTYATEPRVVFVGGPMQPSAAIGLARRGDAVETVDLEQDPDYLDWPVTSVRVFAGYAGWTGGQLEDEIAAGAWLVIDADPNDVMTDDPEALWPSVLRRQGGRLAAVADFPLDPTEN